MNNETEDNTSISEKKLDKLIEAFEKANSAYSRLEDVIESFYDKLIERLREK